MKRWLPLLALAAIVFVGWLAVSSGPNGPSKSEPSYNGRSLSSWLKDFGSRPIGGGLIHDKLSNARQRPPSSSPGIAIRAMGTNVIEPLLLQIKLSGDPPWLVQVKQILNRQKFLKLQLRDSQARQEQAAMAFYELGTAGTPALPELASLLTNYSSATCAAHALVGMGTTAIPVFAATLTNSNTWISDCGVWGLAQIGADSRVAVPQILIQLPKGNTADQMLTLWALGEIREPIEIIRTELANQLKNSDPRLRNVTAQALQKFGTDAKPVSDEIKTALEKETDVDTRAALKKLADAINLDGDLPRTSAY